MLDNNPVVVLYGGVSPERPVSLRSGEAVINALKKNNVSPLYFDTGKDNSFIRLIPDNSLVLPILHGHGGEDGEIQKLLEQNRLNFLGSDSVSSNRCFNKNITRNMLARHGIPIAQGAAITIKDYHKHPLAKAPHVLKVSRGGSSIGTLIVTSSAEISSKNIAEVFSYDSEAVIEQYIRGVEITVPILGNKALPVIEILPPEGELFDYKNKYNGRTRELCPPKSLNEQTQRKVQRLAEQVHKIMGCRHLSRVDMIIQTNGSPIVLEINTMPGLTDQSLYPKGAAQAGLTFPKLVKSFVDMVQKESNES